MNRRARAIALLALAAAPARADEATAPAIAAAAVGALDASFLVFDAVTVARKKPPGLAYAIVELALSAPQVVLGPLAIAAGADGRAPRDLYLGAGVAITALAALALAHAVWATATRGWANAPRVH